LDTTSDININETIHDNDDFRPCKQTYHKGQLVSAATVN